MKRSGKTLKQWLNELENRHVQEIQLGLSRIKRVADELDLLNPGPIVITVAGTNGKGSVVATLEEIYSNSGYRVGVYTSPHLIAFNERIRINKKAIEDEQLENYFELIDFARKDTALTFFEMATLAALLHFEQHDLDLVVLEVGLGGRLDATNIIDNDLAIITTVDFDHQEYLGTSLDAIGTEKAGILRSNRAFIGAASDLPSSVLKRAMDVAKPVFINGQDYSYKIADDILEINFQTQLLQFPKPHLHPDSVVAAVIASKILSEKLPVEDKDIAISIKSVHLPARLQMIEQNDKRLLLDVAHNPQSARFLAEFVTQQKIHGNIHAVFSALNDKDIKGIVEPLLPLVDYWYPARLESKRACVAEQLLKELPENIEQTKGYFSSPEEAYEAAFRQAKAGDLIIAFGSFILVGAVLNAVSDSYLEELL
ncbi:bifunctional protein FolC [Legionella quinlivanii]|uniref:Dihydrofolate synthase/folylpolyglutamate synthase n=1 Tax=Legionella quinlivanii TaxID=45073 RepID=A0A0W0Y4E6_9GAMM|nr:bifunctional tetrahydrofolate synthase/dihydrofolate synthase [Legionella quinlivanii]KTD51584.1 bifunctional protein FolC [Legionella quinlivanii]MCW8450922.1 bifunctional tetrahydrofolate synthase/dihydrofolate synthase [Legionella quinlivanii]SEF59794.1 dihydrofolate synthase / folylpolyglutamate synthase [Legionella quinlivanii DSM 21216]STY10889.1 folylpolyglutamate synthase [Legionella quinlivanii]